MELGGIQEGIAACQDVSLNREHLASDELVALLT